MKLLDIVNAPWAIEPGKLQEIAGIYATHLRGDKIDLAGVESRLGRPLHSEPKAYDITDGVAVLPLEGVLAKRANLMTQVSGGTSTQLAARDLRAAAADPAVHSIILAIDSPGGTVDGTATLADVVREVSATKPVVAWASGTMASAAYWVGSAAQRVYVADPTTQVGSIGVVATHVDISKAEEARGVKTTEIVAGQYKRIASQYAPLTPAGRQTMQDQVDYTYGLFVQAVAAHRGVSVDQVVADMADGRTFLGQQAIDAGLVDGMTSLGALVQQLNAERAGVPGAAATARSPRAAATPTRSAGDAPPVANLPTPQAPTMMTIDDIKAQAPDVAAALTAEGAAQERARIQAVEAQLLPGHEVLIQTLKYDGKSTAGDAAMAVLAADKAARSAQAAALAADAPAPVGAGANTGPGTTGNEPSAPQAPVARTPDGFAPASTERANLHVAAVAHMAAHPGSTYLQAVKAVQTNQPQPTPAGA